MIDMHTRMKKKRKKKRNIKKEKKKFWKKRKRKHLEKEKQEILKGTKNRKKIYIYIMFVSVTHGHEVEDMINIIPVTRSEICCDEVSQGTVSRILRGRDTCSHSKVEHCCWEKRWLCWEVGMWSTGDQLHFDVFYTCSCVGNYFCTK